MSNKRHEPIDVMFQKYLDTENAMDPIILTFIREFIETRNVADASRKAGINVSSGHRILRFPDVQTCIKKIVAQWARENNFDIDTVLENVNEIANVDVLDVFNEDGTYKKLIDIPDKTRRAIKKLKKKYLYGQDMNGMEIKIGEIIEIEFWDKLKANELLGKHKGAFVENVKVTHEIGDTASILLQRSEQKAYEKLKLINPTNETPLDMIVAPAGRLEYKDEYK